MSNSYRLRGPEPTRPSVHGLPQGENTEVKHALLRASSCSPSSPHPFVRIEEVLRLVPPGKLRILVYIIWVLQFLLAGLSQTVFHVTTELSSPAFSLAELIYSGVLPGYSSFS